jgi:hypothetical protein
MTTIALSLPKLELLRTEVRARRRHLAFASLSQQRLAAGLRDQARPGEEDRARRDVRDPPARERPLGLAVSVPRMEGRSSKGMRRARQRLPADQGDHRRPGRRRVGRARRRERGWRCRRADRAGAVRAEVVLD